MDIPRGHAMLPLNETDFLDFIFNYFKAEYSPIRSIWSTASALPTSAYRWQAMGKELFPHNFRPANAQAQKDIESLDYFIRRWDLDASFVRGIVIRFATFEGHERLEKKLFECCRIDLLVRKALKEKHLIDKLWPSPAPRDIPRDLLHQGVQVRKWYGDMFGKYFKHLHSVEDFSLRSEIDVRIKGSTTLMLVPYVDHLVFGAVEPIVPIVATGSGFSNSTGAWKRIKERESAKSFGEPARFEVRFEAEEGMGEETVVKSVVRQCQCLKCGSKRDVHVDISIDPAAGPTNSNMGKQRGREPTEQNPSRTAMKYSPGYSMPGADDEAPPPQPPRPQSDPQTPRSSSPQQKKQCPACTFFNHPDLTACEMCQSELPDSVTTIPSSPPPAVPPRQSGSNTQSRHAYSASVPPPTATGQEQKESSLSSFKPALPSRQSISSTLFAIFPFSQQLQSEHHAHLPSTQPGGDETTTVPTATKTEGESTTEHPLTNAQPQAKGKNKHMDEENSSLLPPQPSELSPPTSPISGFPEMAMMPLTPPPTSTSSSSGAHARQLPVGLPRNLMDDFVPVPVSPFFRDEGEDEEAGWGEMRGEHVGRGKAVRDSDDDSGSDEDEDEERGRGRGRGSREGLIDLDAVAREEMGVWGERE
ncbi:hypothetical protein P280DRAFT_140080 [Massarina eburnea CBS 473.64]|uniref:RanBP2-type domain-containing protein n=1 Tax=Massarina eburnea CBS 473.64 TaxID=1395130 RepID=A0A6A6RNA1_9PLEO|nr:hypothetical protein P280DRAFT_140080 [Massarina eburnea CBS 473.64]